MKLTETIEHEMPSEVTYLDYLILDPQDDHILIKAKSPLIYSFMKHQSKGKKKKYEGFWGGDGEYFNVGDNKIKLPRDGSITFNNIGGTIFGETNRDVGGLRTNLSWLRHTDLKEGMEIRINGVCAMADFEDYINSAADAIRNFYLQNIRKAVISLRMGEHFPPSDTGGD